jgi:hypothetical protein
MAWPFHRSVTARRRDVPDERRNDDEGSLPSEDVLGSVLEEPAEITTTVGEALDEIATGRTTVAYSTTELEEQLRGLEPTDD